ncbi:hypothetical protein ACWOB1_07170 [Facklamia languida]|uniref:Uncharacterized protein n=1 Tax=Facklamia languida CCUG 37842 TaxID=883113 RepID=H3NIM2_9LACT|nr:hypothetical protein [Facklamia languida]EHR37532.1 hypothetical protein HMPREF9708_00711 [Facklamia languida CCUG 37842]
MNPQSKKWTDYLAMAGWIGQLFLLAWFSLGFTGGDPSLVHRLSPQAWLLYLVWGLALWQGIPVAIPWLRKNQAFKTHYQQFLAPELGRFYLFQVVLFLSWIYDIHLSMMVFALLNGQLLVRLVQVISLKPILRTNPWFLKFPIGALTSSVLVLALWAFYDYCIRIGLGHYPVLAVTIAGIVLMVLAGGVFYLYVKYGNPALVPPLLVYLVALLCHHWPRLSFQAQDPIIFYIVLVLLVVLTSLYGRYSYLQWKQAADHKED